MDSLASRIHASFELISLVLPRVSPFLASRAEMAYIEQTTKMVPFITCEISLCQYVCDLVFGVNIFNSNLGIKINSIKEPIKSNSVGSGNMSHGRASSL